MQVTEAIRLPDGLVYVSDADPGIMRIRAGKGFAYRDAAGKLIPPEDRARIRKLGIPPAYRNVWICDRPNGHLQATGLDAKGRKQYRYHPLWAGWRAETKYADLVAFGEALPTIRRRLDNDLRGTAGDLDFSLAALVMLLDRAYLRIGNSAYTAQNRSFGATTLLSRHLTLTEGEVRLRFRAKGGKRVSHVLRGKRLHRIMQEIGDLPGRNLFTYIDADGAARSIGSQNVNAYLAETSGIPGVTAKTFRTWGGTLAAFETACAATDALTVRMMAEAAAERLTNTPTISRKSYIHPAVLDLASLDASARVELLDRTQPLEKPALTVKERRLLAFLQSRAGTATASASA